MTGEAAVQPAPIPKLSPRPSEAARMSQAVPGTQGEAGSPPNQPGRQEGHDQKEPVKTGKAVRGFFYHVREYQRIKQQERRFAGKIIHGLIDPFDAYIQATRLGLFSWKYSVDGRSPILTDALVKTVLDSNGLTKKGREARAQAGDAAKTTDAAHQSLLKLAGIQREGRGKQLKEEMGEAQRKRATEVLGEVLHAKGNLTSEQRDALAEKYKARRLTRADVDALCDSVTSTMKLGESAGIKFKTSNEFIDNDVLIDQLLYAGLTPEQQAQARKVMWLTHGAAVATAARYGALFITGGMSFWASVGAQAAITGASRIPVLLSQGSVHDMNEMRGANVYSTNAAPLSDAEKFIGKAFRFMAVDWERSKATYPWQVVRAAAFGGGLGALTHIVPHAGDIAQNIGHHINIGEASAHAAHTASEASNMPLPDTSHLHSLTIGGQEFQVGGNVQYDPGSHDLFILDHGQHVNIAHIDNGHIQNLNGYNVAENQGPDITQNTTDYLHAHGSQTLSPEHHSVVADQRQFEAYVKANPDGSADLTLPPGDNAIALPNGEMLHFSPQDVHVDGNVTTIHVAPDDPMYHALIDPKAMHQFYVDDPHGGTMLDGVHNGATTTYMTGHWDGNVFEQHSTVNGSYEMPEHITTPQTTLEITHPVPASFPHGEENMTGEVFATSQGQAVHDAMNQAWDEIVSDNVGRLVDTGVGIQQHISELLAQHNPVEFALAHPGEAVKDAVPYAVLGYGGFALGRYRKQAGPNNLDRGLYVAEAALAVVNPGYATAAATGYILGRLGRRAREGSGGSSTTDSTSRIIPTPPQPFKPRQPRQLLAVRDKEEERAEERLPGGPGGDGSSGNNSSADPSLQPAPTPQPARAEQEAVLIATPSGSVPPVPGVPAAPVIITPTLGNNEALSGTALAATGSGKGPTESGGNQSVDTFRAVESFNTVAPFTGLERVTGSRIGIETAAGSLIRDLRYSTLVSSMTNGALLSSEFEEGKRGEQIERLQDAVNIHPELKDNTNLQEMLERLRALPPGTSAEDVARMYQEALQAVSHISPPRSDVELIEKSERILQDTNHPIDPVDRDTIVDMIESTPGGQALLAKQKVLSDAEHDETLKRILETDDEVGMMNHVFDEMDPEIKVTSVDIPAIAQALFGRSDEATVEKVQNAFTQAQTRKGVVDPDFFGPPPVANGTSKSAASIPRVIPMPAAGNGSGIDGAEGKSNPAEATTDTDGTGGSTTGAGSFQAAPATLSSAATDTPDTAQNQSLPEGGFQQPLVDMQSAINSALAGVGIEGSEGISKLSPADARQLRQRIAESLQEKYGPGHEAEIEGRLNDILPIRYE